MKYFDIFASSNWRGRGAGIDSVHAEWAGSQDVKDEEVLIAVYSYEDYSGSAFLLYRRNGVLFEVHDSHCSCYGLERFEPEETTVEALKMRDYSEYGTEFNEAYKALVSSLG